MALQDTRTSNQLLASLNIAENIQILSSPIQLPVTTFFLADIVSFDSSPPYTSVIVSGHPSSLLKISPFGALIWMRKMIFKPKGSQNEIIFAKLQLKAVMCLHMRAKWGNFQSWQSLAQSMNPTRIIELGSNLI